MLHSMLADLPDLTNTPAASEGREGCVVELLWQCVECSHDPGFFDDPGEALTPRVIGLQVIHQGRDITDALPCWTLGLLEDVVLDAERSRRAMAA